MPAPSRQPSPPYTWKLGSLPEDRVDCLSHHGQRKDPAPILVQSSDQDHELASQPEKQQRHRYLIVLGINRFTMIRTGYQSSQ